MFDLDFSFFNSFWSEKDIEHANDPPVELYKQYFSEDTYNSKSKLPDELVSFDIEIMGLFESRNLGLEQDINYAAKFLSNFCKDSENYISLSQDGKAKIDSIFNGKCQAVQRAVDQSGCSK